MTDPIETLPLFNMEPSEKRARGEVAKRTPVAGWTSCPNCRSHERVAVVWDGEHLVYRHHTYTTVRGTQIECPASWQRVCVLLPRPYFGPKSIKGCPCAHRPSR